MTEEARFFLGLGVTAVVNAGLVGAAWGNLSEGQKQLRKDMDNVKKALGLTNGSPGRFVPREELSLMRETADGEHKEFRRRLEALEDGGDA